MFAGFLPRVVHPAHVKDAKLIELLRSMAETVGVDGFIRQQTRRERFLREIEAVVPWARLVALIGPLYLAGKRGRPPLGGERMLSIYFLHRWYALTDEALEDALYDSRAMRTIMGDLVPDATTLLKFSHLLERHRPTGRVFAEINALFAECGVFFA